MRANLIILWLDDIDPNFKLPLSTQLVFLLSCETSLELLVKNLHILSPNTSDATHMPIITRSWIIVVARRIYWHTFDSLVWFSFPEPFCFTRENCARSESETPESLLENQLNCLDNESRRFISIVESDL